MVTARTYRYLHLDVFTDRLFGGNQLAVYLEPQGLSAAEMQSIAREMNFSETTFVWPPEDPRTDVRVRIFTPGKELPMAGHPTIGTAFALGHAGVVQAGRPEVFFGLGVGPIRVELTWEAGKLAFAWMTQLPPTFGPVVRTTDTVASALGVQARQITSTGMPIEQVSCGVPFLFVPLATRAAVDAAALNYGAMREVYRQTGLDEDLGVFVFSMEKGSDGGTVYSRMFAPGLGVNEDPATGAASGPLGCYLVQHKLVTASGAGDIVSVQGVKMGRPSRVQIAIGTDKGTITTVRVGGTAVLAGEGTLRM